MAGVTSDAPATRDRGPSIYQRTKADPGSYFTQEELRKSRSYNRPLRYLRILSLVVNTAWVLAFVLLEGGPRLIEMTGFEAWPLQLALVAAALVVIGTVVNWPISLYRTFVHEERWGFNTQTPRLWAADQIKSILIGLVVASAVFLALWYLIRSTDLWWLFGALVLTAFSVVLAAIAPVVIMPLFNKFTPVEDEVLREHLRDLAQRGGVSVSDVEVMDASKRTRHDNAFFAGMGRTRKLVIFDNMVSWDRDVIDVVVAHEVGHWRHHHLISSVAVGTITSFVVFVFVRLVMGWEAILAFAGVDSVRDPGALPLFLLTFSAVGVFSSLIDAFLSRVHERQADRFALDLTQDHDAFANVWREFIEKDLPELDPSLWKRVRASHPPIAERLAFADSWKAARSGT